MMTPHVAQSIANLIAWTLILSLAFGVLLALCAIDDRVRGWHDDTGDDVRDGS